MNNKILLGSIIALCILVGVSFTSVVGISDGESNTTHSLGVNGGLIGRVIIVGIVKNISSNDSVVDITIGIIDPIIFFIGLHFRSHAGWLPHIGFIRNIDEIEIYDFKGITTDKFILGRGKVDGWFH